MCYAPLFAKISNENGIAKALANSKPICGVGYMPRRWRTLAKSKTPPFILKRREIREASEGTSEFLFFRPFFVERQRKGIKSNPLSARQKRAV